MHRPLPHRFFPARPTATTEGVGDPLPEPGGLADHGNATADRPENIAVELLSG